jgi:hypothetical protein
MDNFNLDFINHGNIYYIISWLSTRDTVLHTNDGYDVTWSLHGGTEERRNLWEEHRGGKASQGRANQCLDVVVSRFYMAGSIS